MEFKFNSHNLIQPPKIAICRIDTQMLGYLNPKSIVIKPTFCSLSELTFTVYEGSNFYDSVRKYMVLEVEGFGRWQIETVDISNDGTTEYKSVSAFSYEASLNRCTLTYKDDTVFKLWDAINPEKTLLGIISSQTGWTIDHVDGSLLNSYRTMSIDGEEVYGLMVGDISEAFKCYFVFDGQSKKISCYDRDRDVVNSGINLSFRNLIQNINIKQSSEDIITALTVTGAEGVGINLVNPLGNNVIYDFSYYCNAEPWGMPLDIQSALNMWNVKLKNSEEAYRLLVEQRRTISDDKVRIDGELTVLKGELKGLMDVQAVNISANNEEGLRDVYPKIQNKETQIKAKEEERALKEERYQSCLESISDIVQELSFEKNFTPEQYEVLKHYINSSVYENENFIFTSNQTEAEKIDIANQLYEQGKKVMNKLSKPMFEFECDVAEFMFSKKYEEFSKALELGVGVNLEVEDGHWETPKFLQAIIDYDNTENTAIVLSDSFRLMDSIYEFSDGFAQTVKAGRKTSLSAPLWDEPNKNGFYSTVNDYITNALNLANQEIINATSQEITLGSYGLRGKKYLENEDTYDPHQVALTNNVLAFTDDNWQSCKMALGNLTIGNTNYYGIVAEAIVGNLIAGEQLTIQNSNNSFILDGNGALLTNADFTVTNGKSKIVINPDDGFKIQKSTGVDIWEDVLSQDTEGNIIAKSIKLETGSIGGWTIKEDGLYSPTGDKIKSDGTGKISLMTWDNTTARFDGNIYANNLQWRYDDSYSNIFSYDSLGLPSMSGSWLGTGSVGKTKLDTLWVTEIDGMIADFDEIRATLITADILKAGVIGAEDIYFGGRMYVGDNSNIDNRAQLYCRQKDISSEIKGQYSLFAEAAGTIELTTGEYGSVNINSNHLTARNVSAYTFTAGADINSTNVNTTNLNVTGSTSINTATFEGEVVCNKKLTLKHELWLEGNQILGVCGDNDDFGYGRTETITIGDKTLKFIHGILV